MNFEAQCFQRESEKAVAEAQKEMENLAPATDEATTKRNQEKLQKIFEKMKKEMNNTLDKQQAKVIKEMGTMTGEQQKDVISFWTQMGGVLKSVLDWMGRMFDKLVDMLQKGWKLVKETTKKFFQSVIDFFKNAF